MKARIFSALSYLLFLLKGNILCSKNQNNLLDEAGKLWFWKSN
jgi:hypothetical protein